MRMYWPGVWVRQPRPGLIDQADGVAGLGMDRDDPAAQGGAWSAADR